MPKIITKQTRRKMLAKHEDGYTFPELKEEFHIKDTRTLQRNLQEAERERDEREVRIRICTDSQQLHLDEIRSLVERCQEKFKVEFPSGDFNLSVENDDLFESLKDHFPNKTLWANHAKWKENARRYKNLWDEVVEVGNRKAKQDTGLKRPVDGVEGLAAHFVSSALWYAMDLRKKWVETVKRGFADQKDEESVPPVKELYEERPRQASCLYALGFVPEREDIAWGSKESVSACIKAHHALITTFWKNPKIFDLATLRINLTDLENQLKRELRLALLKRSYISHVCDFCPVRAFMVEEI